MEVLKKCENSKIVKNVGNILKVYLKIKKNIGTRTGVVTMNYKPAWTPTRHLPDNHPTTTHHIDKNVIRMLNNKYIVIFA